MSRYLVDTNVFLYARGEEHPYRGPCRAVLRAARDKRIELEASVELVQEFVHVLLRRGLDHRTAVAEAAEVRGQCRRLHPFDGAVLTDALSLLAEHEQLGARDAIHAATARRAGLTAILSADTAFDDVGGLLRSDPAAPEAPWLSPQ